MKIKLLIIILLISTFCKADQLADLTKDEALKATEYLRRQSTVVLWCACCEGNNPKQIVTVSNVYFEATGDGQLYHIILEGTDNNQRSIKEELDLAYVHINKNGMAVCVGKELGYECDPCTVPFLYPNSNSLTPSNREDTDFTGLYFDKLKNEVIIEGPSKNGAIKFEIHVATASGCIADISGTAYLTGPSLASYYDDPKISKCQLNFSFYKGVLGIRQSEECQYHNGPSCGFEGTYTKKP